MNKIQCFDFTHSLLQHFQKQKPIFRCKLFYLLYLTSRRTSGASLKTSLSPLNFHRLRKIISYSLLPSVSFRVPSLPHSPKAFSSLESAGSLVQLLLAQLSSAILQDVSFPSAIQPGPFPTFSWNMSPKGCPVSSDTLLWDAELTSLQTAGFYNQLF